MKGHLVIVGGGQAAASAAVKAREIDTEIEITIVSEEPVLPYQRPPLSKAYLSGDLPLERLVLRPAAWFEENRVSVKTGIRAEAIDRKRQRVALSNGESLAYDRLLLATGSRARRLPAEQGGDLEGVFTLRSTQDADQLAPALFAAKNAVVIGGGYIGLEGAAIARKAGVNVTIVEMAERILQRVAAPATSDFFRDLHQRHGVSVLESTGLDRVAGESGKVSAVQLTDGRSLLADCVLVGIGILPASDLAEEAGLTVENGVVVDEFCATSDPAIFAAGDCTNFPFRDRRQRLESVPHAIHQAEVAVENLLGASRPYEATPWFWSDQYDVKLQIAGLNVGYDSTVTRPGRREGAQSVWYYAGDKLLAVDAMSDAPAFMAARRIIESGKTLPKEAAADPSTNLKDWM